MEEVLSSIFEFVMVALALAYVPLQIYALIKLRGWWRLAALLPIAVIAAVSAMSLRTGTGNLTLIVIVATGAGAAALLLAILSRGRLERAMYRLATGRR